VDEPLNIAVHAEREPTGTEAITGITKKRWIMNTPDASTKPKSAKTSDKSDEKLSLTTNPPMNARQAQASSIFDSCIPGSMLMYPVKQVPASNSPSS